MSFENHRIECVSVQESDFVVTRQFKFSFEKSTFV